jgi:hypothetical protein
MVAFALITEDQVNAFLAAVRRGGFAEADFELQEEEFDQQTAEVEARKGDVGVRCGLIEVVRVYPLGDGSDWVATFASDVKSGKFGYPESGSDKLRHSPTA